MKYVNQLDEWRTDCKDNVYNLVLHFTDFYCRDFPRCLFFAQMAPCSLGQFTCATYLMAALFTRVCTKAKKLRHFSCVPRIYGRLPMLDCNKNWKLQHLYFAKIENLNSTSLSTFLIRHCTEQRYCAYFCKKKYLLLGKS